MLGWWVGLCHDSHSEVSMKDKIRRFTIFFSGHQPQPVVTMDNIVFIHESCKAESVLKAFTARFRTHE